MRYLTSIFCFFASILLANGGEFIAIHWINPLMDTNNTYRMYHATNITLPLDQWPSIATMAGDRNALQLEVNPGVHFFYMTASNFWGVSSNSNVVGTPEIIPPFQMTIKKEGP